MWRKADDNFFRDKLSRVSGSVDSDELWERIQRGVTNAKRPWYSRRNILPFALFAIFTVALSYLQTEEVNKASIQQAKIENYLNRQMKAGLPISPQTARAAEKYLKGANAKIRLYNESLAQTRITHGLNKNVFLASAATGEGVGNVYDLSAENSNAHLFPVAALAARMETVSSIPTDERLSHVSHDYFRVNAAAGGGAVQLGHTPPSQENAKRIAARKRPSFRFWQFSAGAGRPAFTAAFDRVGLFGERDVRIHDRNYHVETIYTIGAESRIGRSPVALGAYYSSTSRTSSTEKSLTVNTSVQLAKIGQGHLALGIGISRRQKDYFTPGFAYSDNGLGRVAMAEGAFNSDPAAFRTTDWGHTVGLAYIGERLLLRAGADNLYECLKKKAPDEISTAKFTAGAAYLIPVCKSVALAPSMEVCRTEYSTSLNNGLQVYINDRLMLGVAQTNLNLTEMERLGTIHLQIGANLGKHCQIMAAYGQASGISVRKANTEHLFSTGLRLAW